MVQISKELAAELIEVADALADAARLATLQHFRAAGLSADNKETDRFDPVILGEEFGSTAGTSGLTWVLDPFDGTRSFLAGTPTWGVLIAVSDENGPIYGLIDQPYIGERFAGGLGRADLRGPMGLRQLKTRAPRPLSEAILFTTFPEVGTPEDGAAFNRVKAQARLTRYGTDCYAYGLIAAGQIDLVIEAGLLAYDVQGPIAVIEAAGGIVTDWQGNPCPMGGRGLAAANRAIHAEALALLNS